METFGALLNLLVTHTEEDLAEEEGEGEDMAEVEEADDEEDDDDDDDDNDDASDSGERLASSSFRRPKPPGPSISVRRHLPEAVPAPAAGSPDNPE